MFCRYCGCELPCEAAFCMKCGKPIGPTNTDHSIKYLAKLSHSTFGFGNSGLTSNDENIVKYLFAVVKNELERLVPNELKQSTKTMLGTRFGLIPVESSVDQPGMWEFSFYNSNGRCAMILFSVVENYLLQNGWVMQNIESTNTEKISFSTHYYTKLS